MGCAQINVCKRDKRLRTMLEQRYTTMQQVAYGRARFIRENQANIHEIYRIKDTLSRGAFGEILLCTHRYIGQKRILKQIPKDLILSEKYRIGLNKEINLMTSLFHPNILNVYEYFEDSRTYYIIMEYCPGGRLDSLLSQRGSLLESDIFQALSYINATMNAHNDIRIGNIMLESRQTLQIKLVGFGAATNFDGGLDNGKLMEYIKHRPPEGHTSEASVKGDIWSCGVIMYLLLTGTYPFEGVTEEEINNAISSMRPEYKTEDFSRISKNAIDLLQKLFTSMSRRPTASQALMHDWFKENIQIHPDSGTINKTLENFQKFRKSNRLREAVCLYIINNCLRSRETKPIWIIFSTIDTNGDGVIHNREFIEFFKQYVDEDSAETIFNNFLYQLGQLEAGCISYLDMLKGALDSELIFSRENLSSAFQVFDEDKDEQITAIDLQRVLSAEEEDRQLWENTIAEYDIEGNGYIYFEEFVDVCNPVLNNSSDTIPKFELITVDQQQFL